MKNISSGYSLIEFALTFVLSVPVIFITLDVSKIMQAKSVGKAAVNSAVRCLSVTDDPGCSQASAIAAKPEYNVLLISSPDKIEPQVSYDGEVKYIEGPQYQVGPFNAVVLNQGFLEVSGTNELVAEVPYYQTESEVVYHRLSDQRAPRITGWQSNGKPKFEGQYNQINFSSNSQQSSIQVNNRTNEERSLSSVFSLPDIYKSEDCLGSGSYNKKSDNSSCVNSEGKVRGILFVEGSGSGKGQDNKPSCGRAELYLQSRAKGSNAKFSDTSDNLTGQSLEDNAKDFLPRGYTLEEQNLVSDSFVDTHYSNNTSTETFRGQILFDLNKEYRVKVKVVYSDNDTDCYKGNAYYKISGGSVFFPGIEELRKKVDCEQEVTACEDISICTEKDHQVLSSKLPSATFQKILRSKPVRKSVAFKKVTKSCELTLANASAKSLVNKSKLAKKECSCYDSEIIALDNTSASGLQSTTCPVDNPGVSDGVLSGDILRNSQQAQNICRTEPPIFDYGVADSTQIKSWWTTSIKSLPSPVSIAALDCKSAKEENLINNAWASLYPQFKRPLKNLTRTSQVSERKLIESGKESSDFPEFDQSDPANLIKTSSYNCGLFKVKSLKPSELEKNENYNPGYLSDSAIIHPNCLGSEDSNLWKSMLASELRTNYRNTSAAFFVPKYTIRQSKKFSCNDGAYNPGCPVFRFNDLSSQQITVLAETNEGSILPAICNQDCNSCQLQLKSVNGDMKAPVYYNAENAKKLAQQELSAFAPWLGRDCGEKSCADFSIQTNDSTASASARIKVPLFTKQIASALGLSANSTNFVEIQEKAERPMERMIAAQ